MIDWLALLFNGLWVVGLAALLATLSWASWRASETRCRLRDALNRASIRLAIHAGLALFCLGLALSDGRWWARALWALLALSFTVQAVLARRHPRTNVRPSPEEE